MSGNSEEEKEAQKAVPLDLARSQTAAVRSVENKTPLLMTSPTLRGMRVLTQGVSSGSNSASGQQTIITSIMPSTILKQDVSDSNRGTVSSLSNAQSSANVGLQRSSQITLSSTTPLVAQSSLGTSYHVPRGPAVVANLAAPRSNVPTVRTPMVVTAQTGQAFVRPPRTPSPAQGTAWLTTNSSTGSQMKGAPTVLSSPVRGASVTGKPQIIGRTQPVSQTVSTIRPGTILQNAITIGQSGQIQSFKPGATGIQALGNTVTIAQVIPSRTQTVSYSTNTSAQFTSNSKLNVASTVQNQKPHLPRSLGSITTARLTVPVNVSQSGTRLVAPQQAAVLTSTARISTIATTQPPTVLSSTARVVTTQPNVTIRGLTVAAGTPTVVSSGGNLLGQPRMLNLHSLVAVSNSTQRNIQAQQGTKVITQPNQGAIHLTPLTSQVKTTASNVNTTGSRTINVPTAAIVTQQRSSLSVSTQPISIAKVFPASENQGATGSVSITTSQPTAGVTTTSVTSYSLASNTYFYDTAGTYSRPFGQQTANYSTLAQSNIQQPKPNIVNTQAVHNVVTNPSMRFNSVMVVEPNRGQQFQSVEVAGPQPHIQNTEPQSLPTKMTSSPRPSILRKRDHEGSPLKAAKNLIPVLQSLPIVNQAPVSPPSRPDSRGNGHSSGGSTTISATSSPGVADVNEDSNPPVGMIKQEDDETKPPIEMSPRKKPRKQQLTGNDMDEHNDDMQFISESNTIKKENDESDGERSDGPRDGGIQDAQREAAVCRPVAPSLLNSYRQTWKATHNHYQRHSDVRPKDERRPTIVDLANQHRVQEKVNGWKIYHLSTQMEDLAEQEQTVYNHLTELLKCTESEETSKQFDKEVNRINELIKGNLQRIKIINDGMIEAKTQIMKIFRHKDHVTDIINRCASKRNFKKREKS